MLDKISFCIYKNGTNYPITDSCHFFLYYTLFFTKILLYHSFFLLFLDILKTVKCNCNQNNNTLEYKLQVSINT